MKQLQDRIREEGKVIGTNILKVDNFLNHQVDPVLMCAMGEAFAEYFKERGITKVFTIESSGIAPAMMTALNLEVPMVILKKQCSKILSGSVYQTKVESFTKGTSYELTLSKDYIVAEDNILIIDDFLAHGEAASGAIRLVEGAGAKVAGVGIVIEKSFQVGRDKLIEKGVDVYSLARVAKLSEEGVEFIEN